MLSKPRSSATQADTNINVASLMAAGGSGKRQLADGPDRSPSAKPSALPMPPISPLNRGSLISSHTL